MSKLEELLNKECPDGVEYVELSSVINYEQPSKYIVENTKYNDDYDTPVLTAGQTFILGYTNEKDGIYKASKKEPVIIFDDFTTSFHWVDFNFKVKSSAMKMLKVIDENKSNFRYLYYCMKNIKYVPLDHTRQWIEKYSKFMIPLPPIKVQKEIVRILDEFTDKTTKLQELLHRETILRKKQYEYYRNYLFNKIQSYNNVLLGDIADISVGSKPEFISDNKTEFEYINAGTTNSGYTNNYNCLGDTVTTPSRGQGGIGYIGYQKNNFWLGALCYQIRSNKDYILTKYIYYYLKNNNELILKIKNSGGLPSVNRNDLIKINIKFPSLEYQKEIIDILDQFDTLCNDITRGLPTEIELRKKQYEYYRDKLLTFKEKNK